MVRKKQKIKRKKITSFQRQKDFEKARNYLVNYIAYLRLADSHLELYHFWDVWKYNFLFCIEYIRLSRKYKILRQRKYRKYSFTIWLKYVPILLVFNILGAIGVWRIMDFGHGDGESFGLYCFPHLFISLTVFHFMSDRKIRRYYDYLTWIMDVFRDIINGKLKE